MARGHHHRSEHGERGSLPHEHPHPGHPAEKHHMHRADGGRADKDEDKVPEERGGKALDYTAESNVVPEAEGERRKHGGRAKRAHGGSVHHHRAAHHGHVAHLHLHKHGGKVRAEGGRVAEEEKKEEEREEHAHGGRVRRRKEVESAGAKTKHRRMDRPGRKVGGAVGADRTPLTTAAKGRQTGHMADADELAPA